MIDHKTQDFLFGNKDSIYKFFAMYYVLNSEPNTTLIYWKEKSFAVTQQVSLLLLSITVGRGRKYVIIIVLTSVAITNALTIVEAKKSTQWLPKKVISIGNHI